jgi:3-oxoacyl-[acyl-carrier-protein] synthase III
VRQPVAQRDDLSQRLQQLGGVPAAASLLQRPPGSGAALQDLAQEPDPVPQGGPAVFALQGSANGLGGEEASADLLRVEGSARQGVRLWMDGIRLASMVVERLSTMACGLASRHGLSPADLAAVIIHGGNGRMPAAVAHRLGLPVEKVWSEAARHGNLGSASLPAAWATRDGIAGPVIWVAIGAGLTLAAALTRGPSASRPRR